MGEDWQVVHDKGRNRFEVHLGDATAELDYYLRGDSMVITHTGVPRAWEGKGIAAAMTRVALDYARAQNLSVVPLCSYAAAYIRRHPEYGDLHAG